MGNRYSLRAEWTRRRARQSLTRGQQRIQVTREKNALHIVCPYSERFRDRIKLLGGHWLRRSEVWTLPASELDALRDLLELVYGTDKVPEWMREETV